MKKAFITDLLFALFLSASIVGLSAQANSTHAADSSYAGLTIAEIMYNPAGSNTEHAKWIEFTNLSLDKIVLSPTGSKTASGWKIKDLKITDSSNHYLYTQENTPIEVKPGEFFIVANDLANFSKDYPDFENIPILKSAITLTTADPSGNYNLTLFDNTFVLDAITYSKDWYKNTDDKGKSLEKIDSSSDNEKGNWAESCKDGGTPGEEPEICETETDTSDESSDTDNADKETGDTDAGTGGNFSSAGNIYLSEILPNPKGGSDDEYIEIVNGESGPIDFFGWVIRDASKSGKYIFKEHTEIGPGEYLAIYRPESKIALNNSKESVYLYDPQGKIISSVSYNKSLKNSSYNFDGKEWHWSKYLTPGKKNKFDTAPSVKIKKPKNVYKNILAEFSAKAKDKEKKKLKYAWDFGDGKKSYLAKTSHKYLETGKYAVTLSVSDASQTVEKKFTVNAKSSPHPNLTIVKLVPNPIGADSNGETINLKNDSERDIGLDGWKIATGSDEKSYNHLISDGVILKANETKKITREISKFSLNNKAGKAQLISPDGKIIDEVAYAKDKIAEGEAYLKIDGEWQWIAPDASEDDAASEEPGENSDTSDANQNEDEGEILGASADLSTPELPNEKAYSAEDAYIFYSSLGIVSPAMETETNYCSTANSISNLSLLFATLT